MKRQTKILAVRMLLSLTTVTAHAATIGYKEKALHHFCRTNCLDGRDPEGDLLTDASGNIYGTTDDGGAANDGTVFKLLPNGKKYDFKPLYAFGVDDSLVAPVGDLILDKDGNLYGAAFDGGANCVSYGGCGTVFERTSGGTYQVLYSFCAAANCTDGTDPWGGVIRNAAGNLVGVTQFGGTKQGLGAGAAYELVNSGGVWTQSVIHTFCSKKNCRDGDEPTSQPVADSSGRFFGVTAGGDPAGTAYVLKPRK